MIQGKQNPLYIF